MLYDPQWLTKHTAQHYPIKDSCTCISQQNTLLPDSLLIDLKIELPPTSLNLKNSFYIKEIIDNLQGYTITIGCIYDNNQFTCLAAYGINKKLQLSSDIADRYYILTPLLQQIPELYKQVFRKIYGSIVIGQTVTYNKGTLSFTQKTASINPVCVFQTQGVQYIKIGDSYLTGLVQLKAGNGVLINVSANTDGSSLVTFSLDPQTAYSGMLSVQQAVQTIKNQLGLPITTINGVKPDAAGNINITGVDCVRVGGKAGTVGSVTISNTCAKPCCDSTKSSTLTQQLDILKQQHNILRDYFVQMGANINYMQANIGSVIGSK